MQIAVSPIILGFYLVGLSSLSYCNEGVEVWYYSHDDWLKEKPVFGKNIILNNFLRSYDYFSTYEQVVKKISHDVLAYVTPLKPLTYKVYGSNDINRTWIESVKSVNKDIKFAPRVIWENWDAGDYQNVLSNNKNRVDCIKALRDFIRNNNFDGVTLEVWMQHFGTSQRDLIDFLIEVAKGLHKDGKIFILPIPPPFSKGNFEGRFGKPHFDLLVNYVDFFSLMSYDYSNPYAPGENAPIAWMTQCVKTLVPDEEDEKSQFSKRSKILLGINFYGYDYVTEKRQGKVVLGHDVVELAKKFSATFRWHEESAEHSLEYTDDRSTKHSLYFPTPYSIAKRVAEAEDLGTGLSIWEIGQGFNSFFEQI